MTAESEKTSKNIAQATLHKVQVNCKLLPITMKDGDGCLTVQLASAAAVGSLTMTVENQLNLAANAG